MAPGSLRWLDGARARMTYGTGGHRSSCTVGFLLTVDVVPPLAVGGTEPVETGLGAPSERGLHLGRADDILHAASLLAH